jgi:hypothetical protein
LLYFSIDNTNANSPQTRLVIERNGAKIYEAMIKIPSPVIQYILCKHPPFLSFQPNNAYLKGTDLGFLDERKKIVQYDREMTELFTVTVTNLF